MDYPLIKRFFPVFLIISVLFISSCGYRFAVGTKLPGEIKKLGIEMFKNKSRESGYEVVFTNALIEEFISKSADTYSSIEKADGILRGTVSRIDIKGVTHSNPDIATERKVVVSVDVDLVDSRGKVIRQLSRLTDEEAYKVSDSRITTELNKQNALSTVSERMAETVYEKLNENY
jgi:hypothetical protein